MYYFEESEKREKKLTRDFVEIHRSALIGVLGLKGQCGVVTEFQKKRYGKQGDVDIAILENPGRENERLIAVEVKVMHLTGQGDFKSEKRNKHHKQLKALSRESWDFVYLFDFIVTEPSQGWFHPQSFEGYKKYRKKVENTDFGQVAFQINAVQGKPDSMAGSISHKEIQSARRLESKKGREKIRNAFDKVKFNHLGYFHDGEID